MGMTVAQLTEACAAHRVGGLPERVVNSAGDLAQAAPDQIAFLADDRYARHLPDTKAAAVLLKENFAVPLSSISDVALLYVPDPETAFLTVLRLLHPPFKEPPGIDPRAAIGPEAQIGRNVYLGPFAVIGARAIVGDDCEIHPGAVVGRNCRLGRGCVLYAHAVLYPDVVLAEDVVIHAGSVVGADGFGYKFRDGRHVKVPQVGNVKIGAQVEVGANSAVDRAALGETVIGEGTKIDNLVQVGHNVRLGAHNILCGRVGVAGSVETGDYVLLGASAGIADHVKLGFGVRVGAMSGVHRDAPPKQELFGYPAVERREAWRQMSALRKLPKLLARVRALEKIVGGAKTEDKEAETE